MKEKEFITEFSEIIQTDMPLTLNTPLKEIEEWDSMAMMAIIAHFDASYGQTLTFSQLENFAVVYDIAKLIPDFSK